MPVRIAIPIPPDEEYPNYFAAVNALGGEAERVTAEADPARYDGLLLPGGADVDPARYHQGMNGTLAPDPALDELQWNVLDHFVQAGKPVLGICRGHQLINVYFGGTLIQHLENSGSHTRDTERDLDRVHPTAARPDSWLAALYGENFVTNSSHHQGVDRPGQGLMIDQVAADGTVEGMHHENGLIFCVQWHPERMCLQYRREDTADGRFLFDWFLNLCGERRTDSKKGSL